MDGQEMGQPASARVSLLVVDSLSFLVAPMLGSAEADGHALMICLGRALKQLAQRHSLVALTTNHLVGGACPTSFAGHAAG